MTCVNCENRIERALKATNGIISAKVNYSKGTAVVTFDAGVVPLAKIEQVIEKLDYKVTKQGQEAGNQTNGLQIAGAVVIILRRHMAQRPK